MGNVVASYPKSGRTWLRVMLNDCGVAASFTHLDADEGISSRYYGKTVLELSDNHNLKGRIVFLYRDPRDVAVSFYHHMRFASYPLRTRIYGTLSRKRPPVSIDDFVLSNRWGCERVARFNLINLRSLDAFGVSYEELQKKTNIKLMEISNYFGADLSENQIRKIVYENSFSKMHKREKSGEYAKGELSNRFSTGGSQDPNSLKVRRGKVGSWRDELMLETQSKINEMLDRYRYFSKIKEMSEMQSGRYSQP